MNAIPSFNRPSTGTGSASPDLLNLLRTVDQNIPPEIRERLMSRLDRMLSYTPKVAFLGKTGAGKSSLCNALFGQKICPVSDVESCTREPQELMARLGRSTGIALLDVPGVGENDERDTEYRALYDSLLPEVDVILWVIKADDRALAVDMDVYAQCVAPHVSQGKPLLLVLNQADAISPQREWDRVRCQPGPTQTANLLRKAEVVARQFGLHQSQVVAVSAEEGYGLGNLVERMVERLPDEHKASLVTRVAPQHRSENLVHETRSAVRRVVEGAMKGAAVGAAAGARFGWMGAAAGAVLGGIGGFLGLW